MQNLGGKIVMKRYFYEPETEFSRFFVVWRILKRQIWGECESKINCERVLMDFKFMKIEALRRCLARTRLTSRRVQ